MTDREFAVMAMTDRELLEQIQARLEQIDARLEQINAVIKELTERKPNWTDTFRNFRRGK